MRWQRVAQLVLILIVAGVIAVVANSLRGKKPPPPAPVPPPPPVKGAELYNPEGATIERFEGGQKILEANLGPHTKFPDGRLAVTGGARILTRRDGKDMVISSDEADIKLRQQEPPSVETATFRGNARLNTADGLEVKSAQASYSEGDGVVRIPGAMEFAKERMKGSGVGANYDRTRDVLNLLAQARISVAPDPANGGGALDGSSNTAVIARPDHFIKMTGNAVLTRDGRTMNADDISITLTDDNNGVRMMQLRGNSRIMGGASGPQAMAAQDIDVVYGGDGRTLQAANLMEHAVVEMSGAAAGKRISARTINIILGPDGSTVTNLTANEGVQVALPPEAGAPAKLIRSAALVASGTPDGGLKTATFTGKVDFRENQAAAANTPAVDRTARSESLIVDTKPGLGAIEKADFRGHVKFVDAPDLTAEAQRGIYYIEKDRVELMPSQDPGPGAIINDGKISVAARTINFTIKGRDLFAETGVKSTILVRKSERNQQSRVPSVLKQDEPVFVASTKLHYQGATSTANYEGGVRLWQSETTIKGDKIVLDDKNGNMLANGNVVTDLYLDETTDSGKKERTQTIGKAETFTYDDKKRLAVYTDKAHITGPQGDITANRIELFLKGAGANELERAEAYAKGAEPVIVRENKRRGTGTHLTYTTADQRYLMIGTPVRMIEEQDKGQCRVAEGSSMWFLRGSQQFQMDGNRVPSKTETVPCASVKL